MAVNPSPTRTSVLDSVERVSAELRGLLSQLSVMPAAGAAEIAETITAVEGAGRLMDAARVRVATTLACEPGMPEQLGFTSSVAAIAALCGIRETSARSRVLVATGVSDDLTISGAAMPAAHPQIGAALDAGELGLDAASLIVSELSTVRGRVDRPILEAAETVMIERATGTSVDGAQFASVVSVDFLATELHQITAAIDPDGARPREVRAMRHRAFRIGQQNSRGNLPVSGELLPQFGLLLAGMVEAHRRSPRFALVGDDQNLDGDGAEHDSRTPDQRRHDIFAEIITLAAAAEDAPQLDGAPVTVLVTVAAEDLADTGDSNDDGFRVSDPGDPIGIMADSRVPLSRRTVERLIDAHGYRTVTHTPAGRITSTSSRQRCFTPNQRLAIAARDGARCAAPGCTTPHYMLQAHHVVPYRDGGPTHIDNGILLCFWHHQQVDTGPWQYRMIDGIPHVRGPGILEWTTRRPPVIKLVEMPPSTSSGTGALEHRWRRER